MANCLIPSLMCGVVVMAFVVELNALDCSNAGDMMFLCLNGNKKRTADSGAAVVQRTKLAGSPTQRRHETRVAERDDQDIRELETDDEALRSRLFEIAARLLETKDAKSRSQADSERSVEQDDDRREFSESAMFEDRSVADERRSDVDVDATGRTLENARKQLLSRWLNEGRTYE